MDNTCMISEWTIIYFTSNCIPLKCSRLPPPSYEVGRVIYYYTYNLLLIH